MMTTKQVEALNAIKNAETLDPKTFHWAVVKSLRDQKLVKAAKGGHIAISNAGLKALRKLEEEAAAA